MAALNGYKLTSQWFDFCDSGRFIIKPLHSALYFYCINLCNKLHWKKNFGLPTDSAMATLGLKNKETYYQALNDLVKFGFVIMAQRSINQHTSNIICLPEKPITTPVGTPFGTVTIVKRINTKTLVNGAEALKTGLVKIFSSVRNDLPVPVIDIEVAAFLIKYPDKDLKKDINLITTWAKRIKYIPEINKQDEFDKTVKRNQERYGS